MPRPKKLESEIMVQIVDAYFTTVAAGNPAMLKFSKLETYASENGYSVKAYDFKRDKLVRDRIEELKQIVWGENRERFLLNTAYKGLDIDGMIKTEKGKNELRAALQVMDGNWKATHDAAVFIKQQYTDLKKRNAATENDLNEARNNIEDLRKTIAALKKESRKKEEENRYLRRMFRTYLYPALANRILEEEKVIQPVQSLAENKVFEDMLDEKGSIPSSAREATSKDRKHRDEIDVLLDRMRLEVE